MAGQEGWDEMSEEQTSVVVLRDPDGALYAVPVNVIEAYRVPEERRAELESALAAPQDDVQGYALYMKYSQITGGVTAHPHTGWMQVNSFQWGVGRGISAPPSGYDLSANKQV
jgi:hypothetical protein